MPVPEIGFIPRIHAVSVGAGHFDLTRRDGLRAWLKAGPSPAETFEIHPDDIAALDAAMREEADAA